ncbi:hypothetical protein GOV07_04385 [Candidatus Woesearchaeota archaeon]|nr:hypothetical protein [Candidatus Woesearchaeota archaeon]
MIELGGNITLDGFADRDYSELIVVKKIVGRYARQLSDAKKGFESLKVTLSVDVGKHTLEAECTISGTTKSASGDAPNLFVALDTALKSLLKEVEK